MSYMSVLGPCFFCKRLFTFNADKVPSVRDPNTNQREPLCESCHTRGNETRKAHGLEPWPDPLPGAYEAEEVPY